MDISRLSELNEKIKTYTSIEQISMEELVECVKELKNALEELSESYLDNLRFRVECWENIMEKYKASPSIGEAYKNAYHHNEKCIRMYEALTELVKENQELFSII